MELWIRSQKKGRLLKIDELHIVEPLTAEMRWFVYSHDYCLGEYSSIERCREIVDEIQTILTKTLITFAKGITKDELNELDKDMHSNGVVCLPNNAEFKSVDIDTFVYQMPEE